MASYTQRGHSGSETALEIADARESVIEALGRMERGERNSLDALRDVLCVYVTTLKAEGASRAQAIEAVRRVIAEPTSVEGAFRLLPPAREALVELAMHWCGEEFGRE